VRAFIFFRSPFGTYFYCVSNRTPVSANSSFSEWVASIWDGRGPQVAIDEILPVTIEADELIDFAFPIHILQNPEGCLKRYILAPTNQQANYYNDRILDRVHGDKKTCFAADSLKEMEDPLYCSILDYVANQTPPGLPDHKLNIKPNTIFRFVKDFSIGQSLVKNARVVVTSVGTRLVTVKPIRSRSLPNDPNPEDVLVPRINFTHQLPSGHTLCRRQFPLAPAYATTFDDCEGLALDRVAIDLTRPALSDDQLYTVLSKIRNRTDGLVRLTPGKTRR
jgi:ATP-dependent DNA helicase PIF1